MPIYEYEHEGAAPAGCPERFEAFQGMAKSPLASCPRCGKPCRRVLSTFGVALGGKSGLMSKRNLEAHGFTQFTRKGKGYYEKTAGPGPKAIADGS
ncbi:MAG: FmdB family zinc ribbon protein [Thermoanaerobaculia bacterium]